MKRIKASKIISLSLVLGVTMYGTIANAASAKTLKATYSNITVSYNGGIKLLSSKPVKINGAVYVPLTSIAEIMGADVNFDGNVIYINGQSASNVSYEQQLAAKNYEIISLKQQLAAQGVDSSGSSSSTTSGKNLNTTAVKKTLREIEDDYNDDYSVNWDFELRIVSDRLELTISYDSSDDSSDFNRISSSTLKSFVRRICSDIADNHGNVEIRGTLENSHNDDTLHKFTYSKSGSFTYDNNNSSSSSSSSLSRIEDDLEDDYKEVDCYNFNLPIKSISIDERDSGDELVFTIRTDLKGKGYDDDWNNLIKNGSKSSLQSRIEKLIDDIVDDVEDERGHYDTITGYISDETYGTIVRDIDDSITLYEATN